MTRATPRKSGVYGLIDLRGACLDAGACTALGLSPTADPVAGLIEAVDLQYSGAVHRYESGEHSTVLAGELYATEALAARLGLPPSTPHGHLAHAALARFGTALPAEMLGEWSLLQWNRRGGAIVSLSAARRDPVLYALVGSRLAIAPDVHRLGRIPWVGDQLDEAGFLFALGRAGLRDQGFERSIYAGVRQLAAGSTLTVAADGSCRVALADVLPPPHRFVGSLADAVTEAEQILRQIMHERLARTARPGVLLSGGLDSSLLAWLAATECGAGQDQFAITSVAPPGSGIADEAAFAAIVAGHLGMSLVPVAPAPELDSFRPCAAILSGANGPPMSNRHCLTEAFQRAARECGVTLLINGCYGEMTATARVGETGFLQQLRRLAGQIRRTLPGRTPPPEPNWFHVRLARHRLAALPEEIRAALAVPEQAYPVYPTSELLGYQPGVIKALRHTNEFYPGALRMDFPFRDVRLLRFFAGLPVALLRSAEFDRAIARMMLDHRLPDSIRLRRTGMPASPDHLVRQKHQAPAARARIAVWRKAGVDEWLDLDWLDAALARIAEHGFAGYAMENEAQLTAMTAEYLVWLRQTG